MVLNESWMTYQCVLPKSIKNWLSTFPLCLKPPSDRIQTENIAHNFSIVEDCCIIISAEIKEEKYICPNMSSKT